MAITVLTDVDVVVNAVNLSDHVKSVLVEEIYEEVDVTAMGDTGRQRLPGLSDSKIDIEFWQDYAASSVDATLYPLAGDQAGFTVVVKPTSAAVSATNPSYTATCHLFSYQGINAEVGAASSFTASMPASGSITRATA